MIVKELEMELIVKESEIRLTVDTAKGSADIFGSVDSWWTSG